MRTGQVSETIVIRAAPSFSLKSKETEAQPLAQGNSRDHWIA